jgi:NTP pyrophosphatase (non-canonical NTP hydrolase)
MIPELDPELLGKIINKYGIDEQMRQTMGECGELIAVLQNYYRAKKYGHRSESIADVMEEAVDVYFMIQQIRHIDPSLFEAFCKVKHQKVLRKFKNEGKES